MQQFIDLFAGCGGLSLGLLRAGWHGVFAVEKNPDAFATLQTNLLQPSGSHKEHFTWPDWLPKRAMAVSTLLNGYRTGLESLRGQIDVIAGGPPCQGFSAAGKRDQYDKRNYLFREFIRVVNIVNPKYVLIENVRGITYPFNGTDLLSNGIASTGYNAAAEITHRLRRSGYESFAKVLNAKELGVPQNRRRYFIIGVRRDLLMHDYDRNDPFTLIDPVRKEFLRTYRIKQDEILSAEEALSDFETAGRHVVPVEGWPSFVQLAEVRPETRYQKQMAGGATRVRPDSARIPNHRPETVSRFKKIQRLCVPGGKLAGPDRSKLGIRKHTIAVLGRDTPSPTLTTLPDDILHYSEPRILTVRECARLQSFPDDFRFLGPYTTGSVRRRYQCPRYSQVGNAVPPRVAEFVGCVLNEYDLRRRDTKNHGKHRQTESKDAKLPIEL